MNLLTQIKHKTQKGEEVIMDIGAKASNVLPENFVEQKERSNLAAKDKLPVIFGKLSKWYADLRPVAWSGSYSDLTNKPTIPEGSAANYQVANNDTTEAEGFVADARIVRTHGLEIDGLSRDLGGCSFEQKGDNFYIVGADSVRKKLAEPIFEKIGGMNPSSSSIPGYCKFDTGITGKVLWQSIFIVPMIIPASGSANNNLYNGGGITYDAKTGVITVNALYVKIVADIYYIID